MAVIEKLKIGVIFGGRSGEHEVSLMSARSILAALNPEKYTITQIGITHEGAWLVGDGVLEAFEKNTWKSLYSGAMFPDPTRRGIYMVQSRDKGELLEFISDLDVIFPVLHGTFGEDGTIQGFLELLSVAYVGAGVLGSALGMDKAVFKDVMRAVGVPVVESITVNRREIQENLDGVLSHGESFAPYPLFVKPVNLGSSVGITKCHNRSDLLEGIMDAARYDRRILIERGVEAREIEVSVLGNDDPKASIPGEIIPADEFYSYEAKYYNDRSQLLIPAPISDETVKKIQSIAIKAYMAVDCAGMARADFLLDKVTNEVYLNEINTIPGFTRISMYPKLWDASGLSYPELVDRLVELALERKRERDQNEYRYSR
ncbi:MAG: D-alanine--D-alanine ligase [Anaerolineales bacterium]|nr:D-alanine--D-alanine ligase [Anaerolineales bacterium]